MLKQIIDIFELLDSPSASGAVVRDYIMETGEAECEINRAASDKGETDFIRITIPGMDGCAIGGDAPTLGIIGRLGGLGARPERIGFVSDGDGALAVLAAAAKLAKMAAQGDRLAGDVIISTHICPDAPTRPHTPVPFMDSPIPMDIKNKWEVSPEMDAILSVDTTKGNKILNHRGFALSPTVKEGYILKTSDDLLDLMAQVTGKLPQVFALAQQDITPYGNGLYHLNSIMQPCTATAAPVVGVAITTEVPVAGCATGATHLTDVEAAARFTLEVAKSFTGGICAFYDQAEFAEITKLYGPMDHFQAGGKVTA
ncbi:DUF1177 domain-containing protein [Sneathiella sp.]|uniref:DUF1177 domain-containing protein n=1 Tax=Sneathiella sp. TaxID=1964365 RepID=UPI00261F3094|nr:DUF1177 domain-containing protein [Sneathiella sp.]MDF2368409.1 DUF1177 domain-containing protein [Sneathiella sp.]